METRINKILTVGDTHITKQSLDECESLFQLIINTAKEYKPDLLIHLGDDLDSFGNVSTETQHFLLEKANIIKDLCPIVFVVGNHSMPINNPDKHSLLPLKFLDNVTVVDGPISKFGFDFLPYMKDGQAFLEKEQKLTNDILFCHQPFKGAQYETGWIDDFSLDVKLTKHKKIISGHVHHEGRVEHCWYPGSPRWLKRSDANNEKYIYILDIKEDTIEKISTWPYVQKIVHYELKEGYLEPDLSEPNTKYLITAEGSLELLSEVHQKWTGKAEIKPILVQQKKFELREKTDYNKALLEYLQEVYVEQFGINKIDLIKEINRRLNE